MINTLFVNDNDLECKCDTLKLSEITTEKLAFVNVDLDRFEMIIYSGKKGTKILKSKYTKTGIIGE